MFHAHFLGVDADGSTYTADRYIVRRAAESQFFDVEDEPYPGGGVVMGTVLIGSSVQRFSHVWLQTPQGWRLVAAHASPIGARANASPGTTGLSSGQIAHQTAVRPLPTVHDVQIRIYGDLAIMRYVQEPFSPPAVRGTRLWVRHGAVWQQALNHQTRFTQRVSK